MVRFEEHPIQREFRTVLRSRASGIVIGRRIQSIAYQGEALVHVAEILRHRCARPAACVVTR